MREITAYLGLGTNLGRRMANLEEALLRLHETEGVRITRLSSLYETAPVGYLNQPDFLNACAEVKTDRSPDELLQVLLGVERDLHRVRTVRWGPRTIDLDLLLYGDAVIRRENLTVPHPRMTERPFVLLPLAEIAGDVPVPGTGRTVARWAEEAGEPEGVKKLPYSIPLPYVTEGGV
ncbi:2-amino-4-hydroxy-6-hydroxymethyldihydropteridine diphosphokinase [Melghirimyces profundicolus]|uniref:2-amino-4-hydroxy-6-hydroxymethyldihydropteridine diphosphokinase n=1 Tax=Melghirimyces profundicolus TaxID=1242148 RepID=A0A2T6BGS0_9BACL|nr:2-amino-4-hydroxy-6-hydroxymethyldihydropteridine diphosphokinase [Melghirimyces profundicolus]PTX55265.1 2-amino-4-hydroxy-6-hydroxymethyldihydropteridine diphosphokinase [Melghirimyces profundicolus]